MYKIFLQIKEALFRFLLLLHPSSFQCCSLVKTIQQSLKEIHKTSRIVGHQWGPFCCYLHFSNLISIFDATSFFKNRKTRCFLAFHFTKCYKSFTLSEALYKTITQNLVYRLSWASCLFPNHPLPFSGKQLLGGASPSNLKTV